MPNDNTALKRAREKQNNEYYTRIEDIEKEIPHYIDYIQGKTIYCNCDTTGSAFIRYFLGLWKQGIIKRLVASGYNAETKEHYYQDTDNPFGVIEYGYYNSRECINLLKEADIVITNPPFSLWRDYLEYLILHKKQYLIIGHYMGITYQRTIQLFKDKQINTGYNRIRYFNTPAGPTEINCFWFTNLPVKKHLELLQHYDIQDYDYLDGTQILNVNNMHKIPAGWGGLLAVPQTALSRLGADQYDIKDIIYHPVVKGRVTFNRYIIQLTPEA